MKTYYYNMLNDENTFLHFPRFENGDGVGILGTSVGDDQGLRDWELHTLEDMRWTDNHQIPINTGVETSSTS